MEYFLKRVLLLILKNPFKVTTILAWCDLCSKLKILFIHDKSMVKLFNKIGYVLNPLIGATTLLLGETIYRKFLLPLPNVNGRIAPAIDADGLQRQMIQEIARKNGLNLSLWESLFLICNTIIRSPDLIIIGSIINTFVILFWSVGLVSKIKKYMMNNRFNKALEDQVFKDILLMDRARFIADPSNRGDVIETDGYVVPHKEMSLPPVSNYAREKKKAREFAKERISRNAYYQDVKKEVFDRFLGEEVDD